MSTTTKDQGHPGLWWQGGDVADEAPRVRQLCEQLNPIPEQRTIPSREQILARGKAPVDAPRELVSARARCAKKAGAR